MGLYLLRIGGTSGVMLTSNLDGFREEAKEGDTDRFQCQEAFQSQRNW